MSVHPVMNENHRRKNLRVVFCANQVSLCIAVELAKIYRSSANYTIFFMPNRCDSIAFRDCNFALIPYTRTNLLKFILMNLAFRPDEVCIPHMKIGRLINVYAKLARSISLIDDGMDTFREKPKNVNPARFKLRTKYYTFTYNFQLATWLNGFEIQKVCSIEKLCMTSHQRVPHDDIYWIIVESPGVGNLCLKRLFHSGNTLVVRHSSPHKNTINTYNQDFIIINGSDIGIENMLMDFTGDVFIGESMSMVFSLLCGNAKSNLHVYLKIDSFDNLKCLKPLFSKKKPSSFSLSVV